MNARAFISGQLDNWRYERRYLRYAGARFAGIRAALGLASAHGAVLVCKLRGHVLHVDSYDAENGTEDISCNRCGYCLRARY